MIPFALTLDRRSQWSVLAGVAILATLACHGSSSTAPNPATTATLIVNVAQPAGAKPSVTVGGPGGYAITFGTTDTLRGLAAGSYSIAAATAVGIDPVVTPFFESAVTGSPANVVIADTSVIGVTFALLTGTGHAWVTSTNGGHPLAAGYNSTQLTTAGAAGTTLSISAAYAAFNAAGDLWVADSGGNALAEYAATLLTASGSPAATTTLTSTALSGPVGLAFDRVGNLWVSNAAANTITEFTAAQLTAGGATTPAVTLSGSALNGPARMSFDVYGNLWVPNAGANTVVAFSPSQLAASGTPTPAITLSPTAGSLDTPRAVAFDEQGNLWVANTAGNTLVSFIPLAQLVSGAPTPAEVLNVPVATGMPTAFAFDNTGDLWVISAASSSVLEYSAQQVSAFGASTPVTVVPVAAGPVSIAFDPPPNGVPILGPQSVGRFRARRQ